MSQFIFQKDKLSTGLIKQEDLNEFELAYLKNTKNFVMNVYHEIDDKLIFINNITFSKDQDPDKYYLHRIAVMENNKCIGYLGQFGITKKIEWGCIPIQSTDLVIKDKDLMKYTFHGCTHDMFYKASRSVKNYWKDLYKTNRLHMIDIYCNPSYICN